jgi:hypothetical protein
MQKIDHIKLFAVQAARHCGYKNGQLRLQGAFCVIS